MHEVLRLDRVEDDDVAARGEDEEARLREAGEGVAASRVRCARKGDLVSAPKPTFAKSTNDGLICANLP